MAVETADFYFSLRMPHKNPPCALLGLRPISTKRPALEVTGLSGPYPDLFHSSKEMATATRMVR